MSTCTSSFLAVLGSAVGAVLLLALALGSSLGGERHGLDDGSADDSTEGDVDGVSAVEGEDETNSAGLAEVAAAEGIDVRSSSVRAIIVAGEPGEYIVVARRKGNAWYVGGITNWRPRKIDVPLAFLKSGDFDATLYVDGSMDESQPNAITKRRQQVGAETSLSVSMAPGGGFTAVLRVK